MNEVQLYHNPLALLQICKAALGRVVGLALVLGANLSFAATASHCEPPVAPSNRTPPDIRINSNNLESPLSSIMASEEPITIDYLPRDLSVSLHIKASAGRLVQVNESQWQLWPDTQQASQVELCAGHFYSRIQIWAGVSKPHLTLSYPSPRQAPAPSAYQQPALFVQVTSAATSRAQLSPHFQLWQFLPQQQSPMGKPLGSASWPQYTLISLGLLEKLELVMDVLAEHNKPASTLRILSGYRSPAHNKRVGGAPYSRHQYGDAVDFIVDGDNDGKMDDLNEDGSVNRLDLDWLTDRLARRSVPVSAGGTGTYQSAGPAAAFIHLDARGRDHYWQ